MMILQSTFRKNYERCHKDLTIGSYYLVLATKQCGSARFNVKTKEFGIQLRFRRGQR